jgi:hypothetical protein
VAHAPCANALSVTLLEKVARSGYRFSNGEMKLPMAEVAPNARISAPRTKVRAVSPRVFSTRRLTPARMERILHAMGLTGRQHRRWTGMSLRECAAEWDISEADWVQELRENIAALRDA